MKVQRWIARREADWKRLAELLATAEKRGLGALDVEGLRALSGLYRSASADLARAKTFAVGEAVVRDLQVLVTRAYSQIYQGSRRQEWRQAMDFYLWGLPEAIRASAGTIALATALCLIGGLIGWWMTWYDPAFVAALAPPELIHKVRDEHELWMGSIVGVEPLASSDITINNLSVSFGAAAGGLTAGLYTVFLMFYNGLDFGALAALVAQNGLSYPFFAFVFPHGALELPAIFFAGAAGLLLARAIVFPGRYRRLDALRLYGRRAALLLWGIIPMLVIAGTIEGFFSPSPVVPAPFKYLCGVLLFGLLIAYSLRRRPA